MSGSRVDTSTVHFRYCDALRGIGIGLVVLSHIVMVVPILEPLMPFRLAFGSWGVSAFFVLSGFLLGRSYIDALLGRMPLPDWRLYARRRFLRIWPAYAVVVLLSTGKSLIHHGLRSSVLADLSTHLLMIHNFFPEFAAGADNISLWTMAVDSQFYLLLPIVAWLLYARTSQPRDPTILIVIAAAVCVSVSWRIVTSAYGPHADDLVFVVQRNIVGMGTSFALGGLLAYLNARSVTCSMPLARTLVAFAVFGTFADFAIAAIAPDGAAFKEFAMDVAGTLSVAMLIYALPLCAWRGLDRAVDARIVGAAAANAYALYLVHVPIKQTIESILVAHHVVPGSAMYGLLFSIGFCICCAVAAHVLHRYVEVPFLSMKERSRELRVAPAIEV